MDLILDWNDLVEGYCYWSEERERFRNFLAEYFKSHNPLDGEKKIRWDEIYSIASSEIERRIRELNWFYRSLLEFGFPEQRYDGPFNVEGNHYVISVNETSHKDGIDVDLMIIEQGNDIILGMLLEENVEPESLSTMLEPKVLSCMRKATPDTLDIIAGHLFTAYKLDLYADC